jgi:7-cyano-7-deazaguanine synthase
LTLGLARKTVVHTPLMWMDKAATWRLAEQLGGKPLVDLIVRETVTCYAGNTTGHDWGRGCGACPACALRRKGFEKYHAA